MANSAWVNLVYARPGHGKSLDLARTVLGLFAEYKTVEKRYPKLPKRLMLCNLKLNQKIEEQQMPHHLKYWEGLKELRYCPRKFCWVSKRRKHSLHDCDIIFDEISNYIPADEYRSLPRWLRKMFSQHRHRGIRIYATTQDYKMVDINFRRMVARAYEVQKVVGSRDISPTLPPVRFVWGIIVKRQFDPEQLEFEGVNSPKLERAPFPKWFLIRRSLVNVYDTTQDLKEYQSTELEHHESKPCKKCGKVHVDHRFV